MLTVVRTNAVRLSVKETDLQWVEYLVVLSEVA